MLIEFEVGNFKSFRDPMRLSMLAANPIKEHIEANTFNAGQYRLLKTAAIYGANASGKSNLLDALVFMKWFVRNSSKSTQVEEEIGVLPFMLDASKETAPSHFEICFLQNNYRYRYGFEADRQAVRKEWLFRAEKLKEVELFIREDDAIDISESFKEGTGIESKTRNNALFLSVVAQFNGEIASSVLKWFSDFRTLHGLLASRYERHTLEMLQDEAKRPLIIDFIRRADVGIEDLLVKEIADKETGSKSLDDDGQEKKKKPKLFELITVHQKFKNGIKDGFANFDFITESDGTQKFIRIAGLLLNCLANGYLVVIDELDGRLHPLLTKAIVKLFNSAESNPKNAQLIFATHDTHLLNLNYLRRDQIWFTEKTQQGATDLYSLAEIKLSEGGKVRNDVALEKNYIQGKYGAIPFLGDFGSLLKEASDGSSRQIQRSK